MARRLRRRRIVHAARLDVGAAFQTFQSRNLVALLRHDTLQLGNLAKQFDDQGFEFGPRKLRKIAWTGHALSKSYSIASGESPKCLAPEVLPRLQFGRRKSLLSQFLRQSPVTADHRGHSRDRRETCIPRLVGSLGRTRPSPLPHWTLDAACGAILAGIECPARIEQLSARRPSPGAAFSNA